MADTVGEAAIREKLVQRQRELEAERERRRKAAAAEAERQPEMVGVNLEAVIKAARSRWEARQVAEANRRGITLGELEAAQEAQQRAIARAEAINGSGCDLEPEDVRRVVRGELDDIEALKAVRRWLAAPAMRPILILCGTVGVGKTVAAAWAIAESGGGSLVRAHELGKRFAPYSHEKGVERLSLSGAVLVLDDLGTEPDPDDKRFAEAFATFVEKRKQRGRTIITSNLTPKEIRSRYNARIIDRLNARAFVVVLETQESLRAGGGGL